ncbi:MAG: gamma-glutamyltransferase family protein [Pseudomonadota bacterium]
MNFSQRRLYPSARSANFGRSAVATSEPLAAQAGMDILARGGNAVDAAIAAAAMLTVTEPTSNGLGSDAFALVHDGKALHGLNASGRAPAGWSLERFAGATQMPTDGWDCVTVPGAVSGWTALRQRFGTMPMAALVEPAALAAREGFGVGPVTAASWKKQVTRVGDGDGFAQTFMPGGRAPEPGELFRFSGAADALELIGESDGAAFYTGAIAEEIVSASQRAGGVHTLEDFAAHRADWVRPISVDAYGLSIHEIPPNTQGIAALIALGILERHDLGDEPDSVRAVHLQIEAIKLALADVYAHVGDPDCMGVSTDQLLAPDYLDRRAALVDLARAGEPETGIPQGGGTVLLCTADRSGMMVSFIQSNFQGFGSGCVTPRYGVSLQNRGAAFSLQAGSPNVLGPGKRPFHTIIPGFATKDGSPFMAFGVMGGPIQAQAHMQLVTRIARFGQGVQTALDAPRFRFIGGRQVGVEDFFPAETLDGLAALGHDVVKETPNVEFGFGGGQVVVRHGELFAAGSDPRKDGMALVR